MMDEALRRCTDSDSPPMSFNKHARSGQKDQDPICIWLTGLSGSGKSTIAKVLDKKLISAGSHSVILDGDAVRQGLNCDLGFSEEDRIENIRRVAEVAKIVVGAGLIAIVALISPYRAHRQAARNRFDLGEFLEVFVDAPLEECERRDPRGLYARVRRGELTDFTGIDSPYDVPLMPDLHLDTVSCSAEECVDQILLVLRQTMSRNSGQAV